MAMLTRDQIYTPQNKPKTTSLVFELSQQADIEAVFTLRDEKEGFISLQKLFIEMTVEDPSEHTFAEQVFGDFPYWLHFRENKVLKKYLVEWRATAEAKRKSLAFNHIINEVKTQGKNSFQAARYLIDEPWKNKRDPSVKAQSSKTTNEAHEEALFQNEGFSADLKRLRTEGLIQ